MREPRIMLATLCLNEMEWLPWLWEQHRNWPGLVRWAFVEAADACYRRANLEMVSGDGLSVDGTTDFLLELAHADPRVVHLPFGISSNDDPAKGKAAARQAYLDDAEHVRPDFVVVLDADEFYTKGHQHEMNGLLRLTSRGHDGMCFRIRNVWRPPSVTSLPLLSLEVTGGLWKMDHCHCWRWLPGMRHERSHVWPQTADGRMMNEQMAMFSRRPSTPEYVHLGWASSARTRLAKTRYYEARGEGVADGRHRWMECRWAWEGWKPGRKLPHGAKVVPYDGPIPEVFR